jgi:phosphoserine phosphatase
MVQIVLIRPGATDFDEQGRIQGTLDIPLSPLGNDEVARVIGELKNKGLEVLYCSDCEPARETADSLAAGLGIKSKKLDHMENLDHGLWQGMQIEEVKRKHPRVYRQWQEQPTSVRPPEGETLGEVMERIRPAVQRLIKKHKHGIIGLVVPEPLATLVRNQLNGRDLGDLWRAGDAHGVWELISLEPQSVPANT